jgi:F-type H+-transporting ATPase subunit b
MHHEAWYHDPKYWVALSFVIFIALFVKYMLPMLLKALDNRGDAIRAQLEQASSLRAEAEALMKEFAARKLTAESDAAAIVAGAKRDAEALKTRAENDLQQFVTRRKEQAELKISQMEKNAEAEIRAMIVDIATRSAATIMREHLASGAPDKAMQDAIAHMKKHLH